MPPFRISIPLFLLLAWPFLLPAQQHFLELHPDSLKGEWEKNLSGWAYCVPDAAPEDTFGMVRSLPFEPFTEDSFYFIRHRVQWLHFGLTNTSLEDSLKLFVIFEHGTNIAELYSRKQGKWEVTKAGAYSFGHATPFKPNHNAIPILLGEGGSGSYYLRLYNYQKRSELTAPTQLVSATTAEHKRKMFYYGKDGFLSFLAFFMGVLVVVCLYAFIFYLARKDKAYLFYSLYLFCLFIYYFKGFESFHRPFVQISFLAKWAPNLETLVSLICFIVYLQFARYFLRLDEAKDRADKWIKYACLFFGALFLTDIAIQLAYGPAVSIKILRNLSPVFILLYAVILVEICRKHPSVLTRFFIVGNCFLLVPIFVMRLADNNAVHYDVAAWGSMRIFHLSAGDFYFLHTKAGMLLEILCFLLGLAWKTREERQEMMNLIVALRSRPAVALVKNTPPPLSDPAPAITDSFIQNATAIVQEHYADQQFSPSKLASAMNMSYSHCANTMKKKTGLSISLFIQQQRLQKANELLLQTDQPISDIAYSTGFSDPSYFSKQFKFAMGMPPTDYRKKKGIL